MKRTLIAVLLIGTLGIVGCNTVEDSVQRETENLIVNDIPMLVEKNIVTKVSGVTKQVQKIEEEKTIEEPIEVIKEQIEPEPQYENYDYDDYNYSNTNGLTQQSGVNDYNGRTETYYSSNVLYHQNTDQWTVDNEGFYRTNEGYYVVAASDKEQGTTFEGSKGTCIVLDSGCNKGITDYYVNW